MNARIEGTPTSTVAGPKRDRIQEKGKMTTKIDPVTEGDSWKGKGKRPDVNAECREKNAVVASWYDEVTRK